MEDALIEDNLDKFYNLVKTNHINFHITDKLVKKYKHSNLIKCAFNKLIIFFTNRIINEMICKFAEYTLIIEHNKRKIMIDDLLNTLSSYGAPPCFEIVYDRPTFCETFNLKKIAVENFDNFLYILRKKYDGQIDNLRIHMILIKSAIVAPGNIKKMVNLYIDRYLEIYK